MYDGAECAQATGGKSRILIQINPGSFKVPAPFNGWTDHSIQWPNTQSVQTTIDKLKT